MQRLQDDDESLGASEAELYEGRLDSCQRALRLQGVHGRVHRVRRHIYGVNGKDRKGLATAAHP